MDEDWWRRAEGFSTADAKLALMRLLGVPETELGAALRELVADLTELQPRVDALVQAPVAEAAAQALPPVVIGMNATVPPVTGSFHIETVTEVVRAQPVDVRELIVDFAALYGFIRMMLDEDLEKMGAAMAGSMLLMVTLVIYERMRSRDS